MGPYARLKGRLRFSTHGPAKELVIRVVVVDIFETIAMPRLECDNWTGHKYIDFLSLLKVDGEWKIMNKVFHLHS